MTKALNCVLVAMNIDPLIFCCNILSQIILINV